MLNDFSAGKINKDKGEIPGYPLNCAVANLI